MKALLTLAALLMATAAHANTHHPLVKACANNEYDVVITLDQTTVKNLGKEIVIVDIIDVSGHGKTYTKVLPKNAWSSALLNLEATSTEDNGKIVLTDMGNLMEIKGEFNLGLQCIERLDN